MSGTDQPRPRGRKDPEEAGRRLLRRQVTAEWRGAWEPRDLTSFERTPAELIPGILARWGLADRALQSRMAADWKEIVGEFLSGQSRPVGLRRGVLEVAVMQPSVRYDLDRNHRRGILAKLKERYGERAVKDVRFSVG